MVRFGVSAFRRAAAYWPQLVRTGCWECGCCASRWPTSPTCAPSTATKRAPPRRPRSRCRRPLLRSRTWCPTMAWVPLWLSRLPRMRVTPLTCWTCLGPRIILCLARPWTRLSGCGTSPDRSASAASSTLILSPLLFSIPEWVSITCLNFSWVSDKFNL